MRFPAVIALLFATAACSKGGGVEPTEETEAESVVPEGAVRLTPEQEASANIATAKAESRTTTGLLQATAEVQPSGDGVARVGPRLSGRITALEVGVGDRVKKHQVLATLEASEVGRARGDYAAAVAAWRVAQQSLDREKALFEQQISAARDLQVAEAEEARARADKDAAASLLRTMGVGTSGSGTTITMTAPIDGVVVERSVTLGQMADQRDECFVIMDLHEIWVQVDVFERDLSQVKVGQKVSARVAAYEREFPGEVAAIGAVVEPKTRAVQLRVVLPNADGALKPGMFATVALEGTTGIAHPRVVIPSAAIQRDGDRAIVFVPRGEHQYAELEVKVGGEAAGFVEIEEGLAAGDAVVTSGSFVLKSEMRKGEMGED